MELVFGSPWSSAVTPVRCSVVEDDVASLTSLLCHARVGSVPAVVWISCLPPKKKLLRNYFTQTALEERLSIFKSIEAKEDGVEMDWNWAGGESVRCWMYVFLACQMSKWNPYDGSHFSSSRWSLLMNPSSRSQLHSWQMNQWRLNPSQRVTLFWESV